MKISAVAGACCMLAMMSSCRARPGAASGDRTVSAETAKAIKATMDFIQHERRAEEADRELRNTTLLQLHTPDTSPNAKQEWELVKPDLIRAGQQKHQVVTPQPKGWRQGDFS